MHATRVPYICSPQLSQLIPLSKLPRQRDISLRVSAIQEMHSHMRWDSPLTAFLDDVEAPHIVERRLARENSAAV